MNGRNKYAAEMRWDRQVKKREEKRSGKSPYRSAKQERELREFMSMLPDAIENATGLPSPTRFIELNKDFL